MLYNALPDALQQLSEPECEYLSHSTGAVSILDFADMLPDAYPTAEEREEGCAWLATVNDRLAVNTARNVTLNAYEMGAISAQRALYTLIENGALDFDLVLAMLATHARTCAVIDGEL